MYYNKLSNYLKLKFGTKVYKICLSSGLSCPNRDGKCGTKGCIFCSETGSGEFTESKQLIVSEQIEKAKVRVSEKIKNGKYIAYFQNFTNTYGNIEYLRKIFYKAIEPNDIVALSIATRPDCLPEEVVDLLAEINKIKPVWVELGLPHETKDMMLQTAKYVGKLTDGIKIHMLYITKNTDIEVDYLNNKFKLFSMEEYISVLAECIKVLPKSVVVHRITGDPPKKDLVAPVWTSNKKYVLNSINTYFNKNNIEQGSNL